VRRPFLFCLLALAISAVPSSQAQTATTDATVELVQVSPPTIRRAEPPPLNASVEELETRGDELRVEKAFLDALDYYRAALAKQPGIAAIYNKAGIAELQMQRYKEAGKDFERAIHFDHAYAQALNNLGVIYYEEKKYNKAIKQYEKALRFRPEFASFHSNMGAAYFSKKEFEEASAAYAKALDIDPDILERTSHSGISAQLPSPDDRARYDYIVAKLCAQRGDQDRALQHLRRAMEEGYKDINDVYKDPGFEGLRKDARFTALMATRPPGIQE
jgi:tetratricopeptide (TPR) repeat protein